MTKRLFGIAFILALLWALAGCPGPKPPPPPVFVEVEVCAQSGNLPNPYCPAREVRKFEKGREPTAFCAVHEAPKHKVCAASGRIPTRWCPETKMVEAEPVLACRSHLPPRHNKPDFIMGIVDPHCRSDFSDEDLRAFAEKIGAAGVDYVRVFIGWEPTDFRESPFLRVEDGRWDLYKPNPAYDALVQRFQRTLAAAGVGILWDISGQQFNREDYAWLFFNRTHNVQGIDVYDYDAKGIEFWKYLINRIIGLIGIEGNRIGLGNEQQAPGDFGATFDKAKVSAWARGWGRPLVDHLLARGVTLPISFSASRWTGKELYNRVCKLDNGDLNQARPWSTMCEHIHGLAMPEHFARYLVNLGGEQRLSVQKHYGISDDGVDYGEWNAVPEDKRGPCGPMHIERPRCTASWQYRLELVKAVKEYCGERLRDIEWMPRELKGLRWDIKALDQVQSVGIWPKIGELYGVDVRRNLG